MENDLTQKLDRTLGLFSAINISAGTMIGSAIFVLAGTSFESAGPSASLSIFLAGLAALFTALSFAELVTFIPTAGGGYAYVRDATHDNILGFITGWGFWLGYSMSCGLFALGFGTFIHYFFPFIPQLSASYALILYITLTNIQGVKNTGLLQNVITTLLLMLLFSYISYGLFHFDPANQKPFFTKEISGMLTTMGFLYMTYIGYGLITTASEEVINPEKTIPRAIIMSLVLVIFVKTAVFFVGSGIIHWESLIPSATDTPFIDTAKKMAGSLGGYLFALAGILATASSINTAMMAASRTSFAMARNRRFPSLFKNIHPKTKTPIFSILVVSFIVIVSTSIRNLSIISTIASVFALVGYSLVNVALMIFRKKLPDVSRTFRVPLYPFTPIAGITINMFLVFQLMETNISALLAASSIVIAGIVYFLFILPKLKNAPQGFTTQIIPAFQRRTQYVSEKAPGYRVIVPVARPQTTQMLLEIGSKLASAGNGKVIPVHVISVPDIMQIDSIYDDPTDEMKIYDGVIQQVKKFNSDCKCIAEPLAIFSRDIPHAIKRAADEADADLILLGWNRSKFSKKMLGGVAYKILQQVPRNIGIFKSGSNTDIKKILYPYGGGYHSQITIELINRLTKNSDIKTTFLRIAPPQTPAEDLKEMELVLQNGISKTGINGKAKIAKSDSISQAIIKESASYDLVILGASGEWGTAHHFTGSITDSIVDGIKCSGLIIRGHRFLTKNKKRREFLNKIKILIGE